MKNPGVGLLVLLFKLGPKLFPLIKALGDELLLFSKTFFSVGAAGTAAVSASLYAYLFTWQTGLGLIVFLIVHEYGHVWAMRKSGVGSKGMYFIPFMGAVAIMDKLVHSARNEAYISIMGPVFGFVFFILPGYFVWFYTGSEAMAAVVALGCFINLINLLPIMPLDGGRMLKSIGYSENALRSLLIICTISLIGAIGAMMVGFYLFALMALIGFTELFGVFGISRYTDKLIRTVFRALITYIVIVFLGFVPSDFTTLPIWLVGVLIIPIAGFSWLVFSDINRFRHSQESFTVAVTAYPWRVLREAYGGLVQVTELKHARVEAIENYTPMPQGAKLPYIMITIVVALMHFAVMASLSETTTGQVFTDLLK